jgi:hypothetical protein
MFCPHCGHQHVSDDTRFCSRCGLSIGLVTDLLTNRGYHLQREKRELTGIGLMMATVLLLLNFLLVFGLIVLPQLGNLAFLWVWISFLVTALIIGGVGLTHLIRGGFFKRLKERETRLRLMKLEDERQKLLSQANIANMIESMPRIDQPASITETTTRELEAVPKTTRETFARRHQ